MSNVPATLKIFLVRHGERKDEVEGWVANSWKDQIDPPLTRKGYQQGQQAFTALYAALRSSARNGSKQRIAVFCSPLRRTVGTSMMTANSLPLQANFEWMPASVDGVIPIVIVNGLCDCAAAIARTGGSRIAIRQRLIDCAAISENDGSPHTPFMKTIACMKQQMHGLEAPKSAAAVQYWRLSDHVHEGNSQHDNLLLPMSPLIYISGKEVPTINGLESSIPSTTATAALPSNNGTSSPLEDCVRLASQWGCHTCIVVTHREEIRDVAKHKCGYEPPPSHHNPKSRVSTPYCCIATFVARVEQEHVQWTFHGVFPFERFDAVRVPVVITSPTAEESYTKMELSLSGEPAQQLCVIQCTPLESVHGKLGASITLTDMKDDECEKEESRSQNYRFRIAEGGRQMVDVLQRLRRKHQVAVGSATWMSSDGLETFISMRIRWSEQAELPCPPPWIRIDLNIPLEKEDTSTNRVHSFCGEMR